MDHFRRTLVQRLRGPLPGKQIAPVYESRPCQAPHYGDPPDDVRQAAVLILLYPGQNGRELPLIQRPRSLSDHAGQIGLPGGAIDSGETSRDAAIREYYEELGAQPHPIEFCGTLTPLFISVSNFLVTPWVAITETVPQWSPNPREVDEMLEVPLAHLLDARNLSSHQWSRDGQTIRSPHFEWQSHRIWGATCMILGELVTVLGN